MSDNPFVKRETIRLVQPKVSQQQMQVVILDRIVEGVTPEYCIHGRTQCYVCQAWCWLGDKTHEVVSSGDTAPMCRQCAATYIPSGRKPVGNVDDHLRADGPH